MVMIVSPKIAATLIGRDRFLAPTLPFRAAAGYSPKRDRAGRWPGRRLAYAARPSHGKTIMIRRQLLQAAFAGLGASALAACATSMDGAGGEPWRRGRLLHTEDFRHGLERWFVEAQEPATVTAKDGLLEIDTPEGLTAWFRPMLTGPVIIEYEAQMVSAGGPNDRVSDLNAFWMATDARSPGDIFATPRNGAFASYDAMKTYYVGQGGNYNTTTRFRRYIGQAGNRPLLPEHDLSAPKDLLTPNRWQTVRLVAFGDLIQYWRDDDKVFEYRDPEPYTEGWFGIRTTKNHMRVRNLRIHALTPA
jgi:hypothetical protein